MTWRELGYNMAYYTPDFERYESLPGWAQETLAAHESDERPHVYSLREFEEGDEFDLQILRKGKSKTLKATMDETGKRVRLHARYHPRRHRVQMAPRVIIESDEARDELCEEMDKLREEIEELRQRLDEKD